MNVLYLDRKTNKIYSLKPCPFCGGEAEIDTETVREMGCHWDSYFVICSKCEARSVGIDERFEEMDKIIEDWNRRVNDDERN